MGREFRVRSPKHHFCILSPAPSSFAIIRALILRITVVCAQDNFEEKALLIENSTGALAYQRGTAQSSPTRRQSASILSVLVLVLLVGGVFADDSRSTPVADPLPLLLAILEEAPQVDDTRTPIPSSEEQSEKKTQIAGIFDLNEAKTTADKVELAKKLLQTGADSVDDSGAQFVLYEMARSFAADSGDVTVAFSAVDAMDKKFKVNGDKLRAKSIVTASAIRYAITPLKKIVRHGIQLADAMLEKDQYVEAGQLVMKLSPLATKLRDRELIDQIKARRDRGRLLYSGSKAAKEAIGKLRADPNDAEAALVAGKFFAFVKDDWQRGLVLLAASSDEKLKMLAQQEMALPTDTAQRKKLGDDWFQLSEESNNVFAESQKARAGLWYRSIQDQVSGLTKVSVNKRIEQLAEVTKPAGEFFRPDQLLRSIGNKSIDLLHNLDTTRNAVKGQWHLTDDQGQSVALTVLAPLRVARIQIPIVPPKQYVLDLEVTRTSGVADFFIGLVYQGAPCGLYLDGFKGTQCGLTAGRKGKNVFHSRRSVPGLARDKRTRIVCTVQKDSLKVDRDGETIIAYKGKRQWDTANVGWAVPRPDQLMLGINDSRIFIHSLKLTPIAQSP